MTSVVRLRRVLEGLVPDAFVDRPISETGTSGNYPSVPLWSASDERLLVAPDGLSESTASTPWPATPHFEFAPDAEVDIDGALGDSLGAEVRQAAQVRGVDALAWYASFHSRGPQWGIYLPMTSIVGVAREVFGDLDMDLSSRLRLAAHVLHQHELFHFSVDRMTLYWELANRMPVWKPRLRLSGEGGYYHREEKLANAYMLNRISAIGPEARGRGRAARLRDFVRRQPAGYRDGITVRGSDFLREVERLCIECAEAAAGGAVAEEAIGPVLMELIRLRARLDWRDCPVHVIHDERRFSLPDFLAALFASVEFVQEPDEFLKMLEKCDSRVRQAWERTKRKLATNLRAPGLDFKQWSRNGPVCEYSVRVDRNFRSHLRLDQRTKEWTAISIGSHSAMGHG